MANVTITACANSTPPANTVVATCALTDSSNAQLFMLADAARNIYGVTGSPMVVGGSAVVTNQVSASISNTLTVGNALSASISNFSGSAAGSPWFVSVTNSPSVVVSSGSVVVTNGLSASISNAVTVAQGASGASPWGVRVLDAAGNAYGVGAGSPLYITGGAAGGTSATDKATYAEGTTSFTPVGGLFSTTTVALTASQSGAVRMTAQRALHTSLRDDTGNILGITGSPLVTSFGSGSVTVTNQVSASISNVASVVVSSGSVVVTNALSASISGGSVALLTGANVIGSASVIQSTGACPAAAWPMRLTDLVDTAAVTTASELLVNVNNSPSVVVSSGSVVVTNSVSASISNVASVVVSSGSVVVTNALSASLSGGSVALLTGANVIGSASVIQGTPAAITAPWPVKLSDGTDSGAVTAASELLVNVNNSPSVVVSSGSLIVTNGLSASISNTVNTAVLNLAGSAAGSPLFVLQTNNTGSAAGSPTFVSVTNVASVIVSSGSMVVTNQVSASISNVASVIVTSGSNVITNIVSASIGSGSVALLTGANTIGAASAIQGAAACPAAAWPVYLTGNSGSRLGVSGSPLIVEDDNGSLAVSGSILSVVSQDISASTSGCTIIVSGCAGFQVRVIGITFTTSASQRIGWISGSNTATSALVQTPMNFATFGGMDVNRGPWGYIWQGGSGSALIITTTTACYVAGNMSFVRVPG